MVASIDGSVEFDPSVDRFNLFAPGVMDNPYPYYSTLRERAPVHFNEEIGLHYLSRYDDVAALGRDRQRLIRGDSISGIFAAYRDTALHRVLIYNNLFALDEPTHGRLKRLVTKTFTRARVEQLVPRMEGICAQLLDEAGLDRNTMRSLAENPEQARALRDDPSLFWTLPDDALRYYSTTQYNIRQAAATIELHDTKIPEGAIVMLLRGSANRDERRFADPDTFDLRRPDSAAHVGFGEGPTSCTGAMLARVEVQVAFRALQRLGEFRITRWDPGPTKLFWGPRAVEVEYQPASR